jgi:hypothetical protein
MHDVISYNECSKHIHFSLFIIKQYVMNWNKVLVGGVAGGVAYFFLGWLFYIILWPMLLPSDPLVPGVMKEMPDLLPLAIGNLTLGFLLAFIFNHWASISTLQRGLKAGAVIGLLVAGGYDFIMYGMTNLFTYKDLVIDVVIFTLISGLAGGVVGYALGMGKK